MEETISLKDLMRTLKKRIVLIGSMAIIAVIVAAIISYFVMTPIYQASTQLLVNQTREETSAFNAQDIQANLQLINTYNVIIKSPAILNKVIDEMDLEYSPSALNQKIMVTSEQNSQVVNISVQDSDPIMAENIANTIANVFQEEIQTLMKVDNVNILAEAEIGPSPAPVKPNPTLNMAIAGVIGLMVGMGLAFLLEYLDTTIRTEQDIEDVLKLPVLGVVSLIPEKEITETSAFKQRRIRGNRDYAKEKEITPIGGTKTHHTF